MKTLLIRVMIIMLLFSQTLRAESYESIAKDAKMRSLMQMTPYQKDAEKAKKAAKKIIEKYKDTAIILKDEKNGLEKNEYLSSTEISKIKNPTSSILIFVSFSIPTQSLAAYLSDAKKVHASVVIRGLIDNSFPKTFEKITELIKASQGEGIELNPLWFKRFGIETVPAVVIVPKGSVCFREPICHKEKDFDVITGDITLSAALREIRNRGSLTADIASSAFQMLEESPHA